MTDLVDFIANNDLDDGLGDVRFQFIVPPREGFKGLPVGNIVH